MSQGSGAPLPDLAIESSKITAYRLNVDYPVGGTKAKFFVARGFGLGAEAVFIEALLAHAIPGHFVRTVANVHGVKRAYEGPMRCPDGTRPYLPSVWHTKPGTITNLLVTAYPIRA